jgi:hypothetical protein
MVCAMEALQAGRAPADPPCWRWTRRGAIAPGRSRSAEPVARRRTPRSVPSRRRAPRVTDSTLRTATGFCSTSSSNTKYRQQSLMPGPAVARPGAVRLRQKHQVVIRSRPHPCCTFPVGGLCSRRGTGRWPDRPRLLAPKLRVDETFARLAAGAGRPRAPNRLGPWASDWPCFPVDVAPTPQPACRHRGAQPHGPTRTLNAAGEADAPADDHRLRHGTRLDSHLSAEELVK